MDGNIKIREKSKITAFLFLFSFLFFPVVIAVPHPIIGYAYYENGIPAKNAVIVAENLDDGEKITGIFTSEDGYYQFDVGIPGPNWKDGQRIKIEAYGVGEYEKWKGSVIIVINFEEPYQIAPDIYLSPEIKIIIIQPVNGSILSGKAFIVGKIEKTKIIEVEKVEIKIDNGKWKEANGKNNWSYLLDTRELSNGKHIIYARALYENGYSNIVHVTVDIKNRDRRIDDFGLLSLLITAVILILLKRKTT